jgi:arylsulfate sulfotransferase
MRASPLGAVLSIVALIVGCSDEGPIDPPVLTPTFHSDTAKANPNNTISAELVIVAARYDSAFVRYWRTGSSAAATPTFAFGPDSVLRIPVLGLDTSATYSLEVNLVSAGDAPVAADTADFTTGSLPSWIPPAVAQGTDTTPGYLILSYPEGPVIVDNLGKVVWYKQSPGGVLNSFQAQGNGRYSILGLTDPTPKFHILDELGTEIGLLECIGFPTRFHDFMIQPDGDYWIMCDDNRIMDLSAVGGVVGANVTGTVVQHISATGQLLFEWNSFDHYQITDLPLIDRTGASVNFTHGNGLELDTDGNLLLSSRSLSEVTKIDAVTGQIIWRLGGLQNQFTFINDPKGFFERQHGVRHAGPGQIQMLDNGLTAPSRFVRYLLNEQTHTALLVMSFVDAPTTYTLVGGSTQYYTNGHGLVSFGQEGRVVEVDAAGNRAWELVGIDNVYVFRAQRIQSLYAPGLRAPTR